jgi:hypothetical protein
MASLLLRQQFVKVVGRRKKGQWSGLHRLASRRIRELVAQRAYEKLPSVSSSLNHVGSTACGEERHKGSVLPISLLGGLGARLSEKGCSELW